MEDKILFAEEQYLSTVVAYVKMKIKEFNNSIKIQRVEATDIQEYMNTSKIDDVETAYIQNEIALTDHKQTFYNKIVNKYQNVIKKPFFAKIEFTEDGEKIKFYIGLTGISDSKMTYVIDWRSPVSSLYYYSEIGKTEYKSPQGVVKANVTKKRQFIIESGHVKYYVDTNATLDNEILQIFLNKSTSNYMTNIVQTIQKEQNNIIREYPDKSIIVNGVAGSGKTSIAIHRIAYQLYINKDKIKSENMLNISPNRLFTSYISQLLPELGEENITTLSLIDLFNNFDLLPKIYGTKIEMYEAILNGDTNRLERIRTKMSYEYYKKLCSYLAKINDYKLFVGIKIMDIEIDEDTIKKCFVPGYSSFNLRYCIERTAEKIAINYFKGKVKKNLSTIKNQITKIALKKLEPLNVFHDFMRCIGDHKDTKEVKYEDITTYVFINLFINDANKSKDILHLFIDEMQDYDALTFVVLKELYPKALFTIVGDFQQNLLYTDLSSKQIMDFFPSAIEYQLLTSYRSTMQIIKFSNSVLERETVQNVIRDGKNPEIKKIKNNDEFGSYVNTILESAKTNNHKVGILVKNIAEAKGISKLLPDFKLMIEENSLSALTSRSLITTIYLSKGLEFDIVIVPNLNRSSYCNDVDRHYLYIAITRALHEFYGFYQDNVCEFIKADYLVSD
jgi:DNA helicase-2/ATP-dependent DNA helicase PcrA